MEFVIENIETICYNLKNKIGGFIMGTEDNKIYRDGNGNNDRRNIQHSEKRNINESTHIPSRIEETSVTQNPPKPRGN